MDERPDPMQLGDDAYARDGGDPYARGYTRGYHHGWMDAPGPVRRVVLVAVFLVGALVGGLLIGVASIR